MTKYSICMTCFNEVSTVRASLTSILSQVNEDFEIVVVDNFSRDGTYEVLNEFENARKLRVIRRRCSRGIGRQIAFENASGEYVIANLDLDDVFLPVLREAVDLYHGKAEGNVMAFFNFPSEPDESWVQNMTIGPRKLIASLGGWRDLNIYEDWDLWSRAGSAQRYRWTSFRFASNQTLHQDSKFAFIRLRRRTDSYVARIKLGWKIFSPGEKLGLSQRLAYIGARIYLLRKGRLIGQNPGFKPLDPSLLISVPGVEGQEKNDACC